MRTDIPAGPATREPDYAADVTPELRRQLADAGVTVRRTDAGHAVAWPPDNVLWAIQPRRLSAALLRCVLKAAEPEGATDADHE